MQFSVEITKITVKKIKRCPTVYKLTFFCFYFQMKASLLQIKINKNLVRNVSFCLQKRK